MFRKQECPDPFKDKVKCEECKHYVDKSDAQEMKTGSKLDFIGDDLRRVTEYVYYCPLHKRKYDRKSSGWCGSYYYKEMSVDENGEPIGYTKIVPTKWEGKDLNSKKK